jgi:hypothetical protein
VQTRRRGEPSSTLLEGSAADSVGSSAERPGGKQPNRVRIAEPCQLSSVCRCRSSPPEKGFARDRASRERDSYRNWYVRHQPTTHFGQTGAVVRYSTGEWLIQDSYLHYVAYRGDEPVPLPYAIYDAFWTPSGQSR